MNVLTPSGYVDIADLSIGDEVAAFDVVTGAPIVNTVLNIEEIRHDYYDHWEQDVDEEGQPVGDPYLVLEPFQWYRINGTYDLFMDQSIWHDANVVYHAKNIQIGDVIFDENDADLVVTSVEEVDGPEVWYRLTISGDHSYISDGLTLHNASRYWVGGTGTWNTRRWAYWYRWVKCPINL